MPSPRALPRSRRSSRVRTAERRTSYSRPQERRPERRAHNSDWQSELDADFAAMSKVWQMLRHGAVRMLGEIGRQY